MLEAVRKLIDREKLFTHHRHLLVGVSGGADSVCLCHLLHILSENYALQLTLVHIHHGLRGAEADADAEFVTTLGAQLNLPVVVKTGNTQALAEAEGISVEMAARALRLRTFKAVAEEVGADGVVLAHHQSDQAETLLFRLASGTSPRGLSGIRSRATLNGLTLLRPLLETPREEIVNWLIARDLSWREDTSNQSDAFLRNRVRHEVLPILRSRLNPAADEHIARVAGMLREDMDYLKRESLALYRRIEIRPGELDVDALMQAPISLRRRVLHQWALDHGLGRAATSRVVERLLALCASTKGSASYEVGAVIFTREYAVLRAGDEVTPFSYEFPAVEGTHALDALGLSIRVELRSCPDFKPGQVLGAYPASVNLNAGRARGKVLCFRSWRVGDCIQPLALDGHKKIQNVFSDAKIPRNHRGKIPLLEVEGEIVWVPGYQIAKGWEVGDLNSEVLFVSIARCL